MKTVKTASQLATVKTASQLAFIQAALSSSAKKVPLFFYTLSRDGGEGEGEVIVRVNVLDQG